MKQRVNDVPGDSSPRHPAYSRWINLLRREKSDPNVYAGVTICDEWYTYSTFKAWITSHDDWENLQIDKDLIVPGNKHYSPQTCAMIPAHINRFMVDGSKGAEYLPGVTLTKNKTNPYGARMHVTENGKSKVVNLGYHRTEAEAHAAWKTAKHKRACEFADGIQDQHIANALRTRYL